MIGISDKPEPTGMAIWRVPVPRPEGVERMTLSYGGPCYIAGYCPTSKNTIYAYLVEANRDRASIDPASYADEMRRLAAPYGGAWPEIAASITDPAQVNYTWFERLLVEGSWHRGRVVLIGDAAHVCPPTLAQGAAMSLEDASVLAEMLTAEQDWGSLDALLTGFYERRIGRVRMVVEASVQLGQWQLDGVRDADAPGLMGRTMSVHGDPVNPVSPRAAHPRSTSTRTSCSRQSRTLVAGHPGLAAARDLDARRNGPEAIAVSGPMFRDRFPRLTDVKARLAAMDAAGRRRPTGLAVSVALPLLGRRGPGPYGVRDWPTRAPPRTSPRPRDRLHGLGLVPLQHPELRRRSPRPRARPGPARRRDLEPRAGTRTVGPRVRAVLDTGRGDRRGRLPAPLRLHARRAPRPVVPVQHRRPTDRERRRPVASDLLRRAGPASGSARSSPRTAAAICPPTSAAPTTPGSSAPTPAAARSRPAAISGSCTSTPLSTTRHVLRELIRRGRPDRVLLGSDFPFDMGTDDPLGALRDVTGLPDPHFHAVRGGNAAALLHVPV